MSARLAVPLALAATLLVAACTRAVPVGPPAAPIGGALATALAADARLDFAGLTRDTLPWRLRLSVAGLTAGDSARLAGQVAALLPRPPEPSAPRELYLHADPATLRGDTAHVEARLGARWPCGATTTGSFAAYRYAFVNRGGAWAFAERMPLGHGDAGPCRD